MNRLGIASMNGEHVSRHFAIACCGCITYTTSMNDCVCVCVFYSIYAMLRMCVFGANYLLSSCLLEFRESLKQKIKISNETLPRKATATANNNDFVFFSFIVIVYYIECFIPTISL